VQHLESELDGIFHRQKQKLTRHKKQEPTPHLTQEERYRIETMLKQIFSLNAIAKGMGRMESTLSRELKRNSRQRGYRFSKLISN
jgi:IS30 family transposase